jgi:hypothetical protein
MNMCKIILMSENNTVISLSGELIGYSKDFVKIRNDNSTSIIPTFNVIQLIIYDGGANEKMDL